VLAAVLLVFIFLQVFLLARGMRDDFGVRNVHQSELAASSTRPLNAEAVADLALIGQLFGSKAVDQAAPDSASALVLSGTFVWSDPKSGMAIVGTGNEPSSVYHVGSELPGGLILSEVFQDRIVVRRGIELETIRFPAWDAGSTVASQPLLAQAAQQPGALLGGFVRAVPITRGATMAGYVVYPADDTSGFSEMGLRGGDMIVAINGTRLDDPKVAPGLVATLAWASGVAVTVKRGGRERDLVLDATQVSQNAQQQRETLALASSARDPIARPFKRRNTSMESSGTEP
jgi:type II secretion system protein C